MSAPHTPVMLSECLAALSSAPEGWVIDGTFGAGGHSRALLAAGRRVLAIDQDPQVARYADELKRAFAERFRFVAGNFRELAELAQVSPISGVLLDLGVSSMQLDAAERGFAFRHDGPLDMRMGAQGLSAAEVVNRFEPDALADIIYRYGEERYSRRIARAIAAARAKGPIATTGALSDIICRAYPPGYRREHPARRTFQALRIYVNDELGALAAALQAAATLLMPGGRLAVISYHSLEDRLVKRAFKDNPALIAITKRPLTASDDEVQRNPRARSAKLRVAEKVSL